MNEEKKEEAFKRIREESIKDWQETDSEMDWQEWVCDSANELEEDGLVAVALYDEVWILHNEFGVTDKQAQYDIILEFYKNECERLNEEDND